MSIVVQKYGGSSVASLEKIRAVAERIVATVAQGHQVVVAVSAMGNTTNELIGLARKLSPTPGRRELDMLISVGERISMALLSMAVADLGCPAVSFTGSQSGIITDESHSAAQIVAVRPHRIRQALDEGKVVIVAGFQGVSRDREVTTLGRGGTDLTAIALAAALDAEWCEICSDVDGIFSADPRVVDNAQPLAEMDLDEALALARAGSKVLQADAVALAHRLGIALQASQTHAGGRGTRIQVEPLPQRLAAVTVDTQLERFESADLLGLTRALVSAGAELRHVGGGYTLVDLRNWHDREQFELPIGASTRGRVAVVALAGRKASAEGERALSGVDALAAAQVQVLDFAASGDLITWTIHVQDATVAQRTIHRVFIEPDIA